MRLQGVALIPHVLFKIDVMNLYPIFDQLMCRLADLVLDEINPEIAELLELLKARDEFDEIAQLFEQSSLPWRSLSQDDRNRLVARASSLVSKGHYSTENPPHLTQLKAKPNS